MKYYQIPLYLIKKEHLANKFFNTDILQTDKLLYKHFYPQSDVFPKKYKVLYKQNALRNIYIISELKKIYAECKEKNVCPPVLLKGSSYLFKIYQNSIGARYLSDIDILVKNEKHKNQIVDILKNNDYFFGSEYSETMEKNNIKIDIHTELLNSKRILWRRNILNINYDKDICRYGDFFHLEDNFDFIYSIFHLAAHHGFLGFKNFIDVFLMLQNPKINLSEIYMIAEEKKILNQLRFILSYLNMIIKLEKEWIIKFKLPYKIKFVNFIFNLSILKNRQYPVNFFLIKHGHLKFIYNILFPSKNILSLKYKKNASYLINYINYIKDILGLI